MSKTNEYIQHILKNLPAKPGVYQMKDQNGTTIYVGKAINLKNRVKSYFQSSRDHTTKTQKLVENIADINYTVVTSDLEAIMLETNLIKELRPKYNVLMKDDKNFVYIKITVNEDFPRILITRQVEKDKARYFGPKTAKHKVEKTLKVLKRIFPYRHCGLAIDYQMPHASADPKRKHIVKVTHATIKYPCIDYHIKRCIGPCIGTVNKEEYREIIDQVIRFLEGRHEEILEKLKNDMARAVAEKKFEIAAAIRDKIQAVQDIMETQHVTTPDHADSDVINYIIRDNKAFFNLFQVREGKLINQENFELNAPTAGEDPGQSHDPTALEAFIEQYYEKATDLPKNILIPHEIAHQSSVEKYITALAERTVKILIPQRGHKDKLLELSLQNAQNFAKLTSTKWEGHQKSGRDEALQAITKILNLPKPPKRMECFDISHIGGTQTVASMVVFSNGFPFKPDYRKFKLHQETPGSPDDFASMEEALTRRLKYLRPSQSGKSFQIVKATKKEQAAILAETKAETEKEKIETPAEIQPLETQPLQPLTIWHTIRQDKTPIAHFLLHPTTTKKALISQLTFSQEPSPDDIPLLLKKIAQKAKANRLYIALPAAQSEPYIAAGCQEASKIPPEFTKALAEPLSESTLLVFDYTKYKDDASFLKKPDLIVIDGGKGQLSSALKALAKYDLHLPMIGLAKKNEEIYTPASQQPTKGPASSETPPRRWAAIILPKTSPVLHLIQHIRDEAHRFAITYQQNLSLKAGKTSFLDEIPSIGHKTKIKLLQHFGSPDNIKNATMYELEKVVGKKTAMAIKETLNK